MPLPACSFCGEYESILTTTIFADGETVSPCGNCVTAYAMSMAAEVSRDLTADQATELGSLFDTIAGNDTRPPKPPAAPAARQPRKRKPADPPEAASEPSGGAATVQLPAAHSCGSETATGDANKLVCDGCGEVLATADDTAG